MTLFLLLVTSFIQVPCFAESKASSCGNIYAAKTSFTTKCEVIEGLGARATGVEPDGSFCKCLAKNFRVENIADSKCNVGLSEVRGLLYDLRSSAEAKYLCGS